MVNLQGSLYSLDLWHPFCFKTICLDCQGQVTGLWKGLLTHTECHLSATQGNSTLLTSLKPVLIYTMSNECDTNKQILSLYSIKTKNQHCTLTISDQCRLTKGCVGRKSCCSYMLAWGSVALGEFFVYFTKKFVSADARRVRPGCFHLTKFCPTLPNFKEAGVLPWGSTIFCQATFIAHFCLFSECKIHKRSKIH